MLIGERSEETPENILLKSSGHKTEKALGV
jgi:hypothetical protein